MIYIGTDIIEISRIDQIIEEKGDRFLSYVFTQTEQSICNSKVLPNMHYGGKFAAKEAVKKALLSSNVIKSIPLNSIEIQNKDDGAPMVILKDEIDCLGSLQVSISHADKYATATAILEIQ